MWVLTVGRLGRFSKASVPTALCTATHPVDIARRYALVSLPLLCGGYQLPLRLLELSFLHGNVVNRAVVRLTGRVNGNM